MLGRQFGERDGAAVADAGATIYQLDFSSRNAEPGGSRRPDLFEQRLRALERGRAAKNGRARSERSVALLQIRGRAMEDAHMIERQAERICADLRHHRFEALPDRRGADVHRHAAVRLQFEPRRLLRPGPRPFDKTADRDAVIAAIDQSALQCAFFCPTEHGEAAVECLTVIAAVASVSTAGPPGSSRGSLYGISAAPIRLARRISALSIPRSPAANSINRSQKKDAS